MRNFYDDSVEYKTHFTWAVIVVVLVFSLLTLRFFHLQIIEGERYEVLATVSHVVRERVAPARGNILDRNGEMLATDIEMADLTAIPQYVRDLDREIERLVELSVLTDEEGISVRGQILEARTGNKRFQKLVVHRNLVSTRCPYDLSVMTFDDRSGKMVCPVCGRSFIDERAVVQAHLHELPGFSVRIRRVRHYPMRQTTAHVVGLVNEVNKVEIEKSNGRFQPGDIIGRSGIERAMDEVLRGIPGEDVYLLGAGNRRLSAQEVPEIQNDLISLPPTRGKDVVLTIDMPLQIAATEALKSVRSGAVVVMDVDTGEILAMASAPTFDPGAFYSQDKQVDPVYSPYMNKAVTAYACGSTFKIITALAALMEGVVSEETEVFCPGFYEYKGRKFRCFKRYGHGKVKLIRAIAESCDTFFYQLGDFLGQDVIAHWARDVFGLGEKTGIELAEDAGLIPTERWYRRHRNGYQPGFALNTAVGQGDVRVTPLAMARAYAAIVNGGRLLRPRLVAAIQDQGGGAMVPTKTTVLRIIDIPEDYLEAVTKGMWGAVNWPSGTAYGARIDALPYAGKTGTAQARETRSGVSESVAAWLLQDHAWFVGYAPAQKPRVVIVVFIEHGGFGGAAAAPIAKSVLETYYREHADEFIGLWKGFDEELEIVR